MMSTCLPKHRLLVLLPPSERENYIPLDSVYSNFQPSLSHINPENKVRKSRVSAAPVPGAPLLYPGLRCSCSCTRGSAPVPGAPLLLLPGRILRQAEPLCATSVARVGGEELRTCPDFGLCFFPDFRQVLNTLVI